MGGIWPVKWICEAAKSLDVFPLAGSIALRLGQRHRDSIFSTCANCKRVACVLWFKQARSKFHLWWLVITCNEWLFLDHPNPSLRMSKIILPGGNSQVWKRLEAQISASSKTWSSQWNGHLFASFLAGSVTATAQRLFKGSGGLNGKYGKRFQNDHTRCQKELVPHVFFRHLRSFHQHSAAFFVWRWTFVGLQKGHPIQLSGRWKNQSVVHWRRLSLREDYENQRCKADISTWGPKIQGETCGETRGTSGSCAVSCFWPCSRSTSLERDVFVVGATPVRWSQYECNFLVVLGVVQQRHQRVTARLSGRHYQGLTSFVGQSMVTYECISRSLASACRKWALNVSV